MKDTFLKILFLHFPVCL